MSIYGVHKLCQALRCDRAFKQHMREDPEGVLADFPLTDVECAAILSGNVRKLHDLGAHGYMLKTLAEAQVVGLSMPLYIERIHTPIES